MCLLMYKGSIQIGCGFFECLYEKIENEKDHFMMKQKNEVEIVNKRK